MSSTTWEGDIEISGDGTFEIEQGIKLILSGAVDVSYLSNLNAYGSIDITGDLTGSGNVNSTNGVTDLSGVNTAFTGKFSVGSGAELSMSSDQGLGSATEISVESGGILNLNTYTPQVIDVAPQNFDDVTPQSFASFASFAIPSKLTKVPAKLAALSKVKAGLKKL